MVASTGSRRNHGIEDSVPATVIWLVRHGETDWNASMRVQGSTDIPLNATGRRQAERVADRLVHAGVSAIYCSPLTRTAETAEPLARALRMGIQVEPTIAERRYGVFQGLTPDEIALRYPEAYARWQARDTAFAPRGGESMQDFRQRVRDGFAGIAASHPGETVAVFSHGGVADMVYRLAHAIDLSQQRKWPVPNAGIHHLRICQDDILVLTWGLVDHLQATHTHDESQRFA